MEIYPGTVHIEAFLTLQEQRALIARCKDIGTQPAGFYTPAVKGGAYMSIQMVCLGMHWNARTYKYEATRADFDGLPVQELPEDLKQLARRAASAADMQIEPDICIMNFYPETARLGLHQDKDETPETLKAGIPVVSISLGNTAKFRVGGTTRKDALTRLLLKSGDAFVMGGPSRLRYHGVAGLIDRSSPGELETKGRFSLTFRQY